MEKFVDTWTANSKERITGKEKRVFLEKIVSLVREHDHGEGAKLFKQFLERRREFFTSLVQEGRWIIQPSPGRADAPSFRTDWRFVTGLGIAHPFEAGFVFDHTFGVPYVPGSMVKGAARAWARLCGWSIEHLRLVFGPEEKEELAAHNFFSPAQGLVVFFDAYPTQWPQLRSIS